jgi:uncharacterized membrane protein
VCKIIAAFIPANNFQARSQNFEKVTVSFVMSVAQYICPHGTTRSNWNDFNEILYLRFYPKALEEIYVVLKFDRNNEYFTWKRTYIYDNMSLNVS